METGVLVLVSRVGNFDDKHPGGELGPLSRECVWKVMPFVTVFGKDMRVGKEGWVRDTIAESRWWMTLHVRG